MTLDERDAAMAANDKLMDRVDGLLALARAELRTLWVEPSPLPAPALTEDAIVAALKADPAMAGRVMAAAAHKTCQEDRREMGEGALQFVRLGGPGTLRSSALQSLAVALAAASYRG